MIITSRRKKQAEIEENAALMERLWTVLLIGAFAVYYLVPWWPLSLLLLVVCGVFCYLQLPLAVSLVPLAMPFFMLPHHVGNKEFSLGETAILLCAAAFVLRGIVAPAQEDAQGLPIWRRFIPASPLERSIALFLLAATAATLAAHFRVYALRQYRLVILEPIVYYLLCVALLRDARGMTRALWALVGAGILVSVLGLGQYLFRPDTLTGYYFSGPAAHPVSHALHQVTSVYGSPNNLGLLLDRAIPVAAVLALALWTLSRRLHAGLPEAVPTTLLGILCMAIVLVLSGTRAGQVAAVAVTVIALLLWRGRREPRLELGALGAVIVGTAAVLWRARHGLSNNAHVHIWLSSLKMVRDHLLLGVGPDNFLYYYVDPKNIDIHNAAERCIPTTLTLPAKHYMDPAAWQEPCISHPHNVILDVWLSTGLVGLIAFVLVVAGFALLALRNLRTPTHGSERAIQVACVAIVVATLGHGLVDNSIFVPDLAVAFWLALALTVNLATLSGPASATPASFANTLTWKRRAR
jgi:O-antigen ligase